LVAGLKALGFDLVFDTNTAADITIIEEGTELLHRLKAKHAAAVSADKVPFGEDQMTPEPMPMFTSCCPGWMALIEKSEPGLANYISTCKVSCMQPLS
jgi:iron only hydrogenase large subunit-like protein